MAVPIILCTFAKNINMKIFAIGMNYAAHNQELHGTLKRPDEPVIFTKADSALLNQGKPFFVPDHLGRIDYETELVVRICRLGKNIPQRFAHRYYDALTVGIDFTARDLQHKASAAGQPWTICKGFDGSAAIGEWVAKEKVLTNPDAPCTESGLQRLQFHLDITPSPVTRQPSHLPSPFLRPFGNKQPEVERTLHPSQKNSPSTATVQEGRTSDMLYNVDEIISYISQFFTLKTGDLLYTGTPAGVGPINIGDHLEGYLGERKVLDFYCR